MLTIERLDLEDAMILIEGAQAKAREIGVPMCAAVADESGYPIAFQRMDGAKTLSTTLAQDKAFTAAIARNTTAAYNEMAVPGKLPFGIQQAMGGRFSTVGGGVPVEIDGETVGALGLSGGSAEQDMACAEAGLAHFMARRDLV